MSTEYHGPDDNIATLMNIHTCACAYIYQEIMGGGGKGLIASFFSGALYD